MIRAALFAAALTLPAAAHAQSTEKAIFAGGCFWCVESDFDKVDGVTATVSGYTGGENDNPTYQDHSRFNHREAVEITFDPSRVSYEDLLRIFFRSVDPPDDGGQFCDRGFSYTTAIYALDAGQRAAAEAAKAEADGVLDDPVVTPIEAAATFWPAEDYHQDYYTKNPVRYSFYRNGCGRDRRIEEVWGDQAMQGIKGS